MASLLSLQNLLTLGGFYCIIYTIKNEGVRPVTENETPLKLCRKWSEMAPGCFDTLDVLCRESHEEMGVSEVCDLPIGAAYEYLRVKCH